MEVCGGPACFLAALPQLLCPILLWMLQSIFIVIVDLHMYMKANMSISTFVWSLLLQYLLSLALVQGVLEHLCDGLFLYTFTKGIQSKCLEARFGWWHGPCVHVCTVCHGSRAHMGRLGCVPKSKHLPPQLRPLWSDNAKSSTNEDSPKTNYVLKLCNQ